MANSFGSDGTFLSGSKTVTAAGTAEALAASGIYNQISIVAKDNNTGFVYVGGSDVASTTNRGMSSGDTLNITPRPGKTLDLAKIYIDVSVSGEGVDFYATY